MRQLNEQKFCGWCGSKVERIGEWVTRCQTCAYVHHVNPSPCSNLLAVRNGKVLMVKRAQEPKKDYYDLPGGYAEIADASIEEAALREFEEEIGISREHLADISYLTSKKAPPYEWHGTVLYNLAFYFVCTLKDSASPIELDTNENSEFIWVTHQDLSDIPFAWDIDKEVLESFFKAGT